MFISFYFILFLLILIINSTIAGDRCNFSSNVPSEGDCDGPLERATNSRITQVLQTTNNGCAINQVPYHPDNDLTQVRCGQCNPNEVDSMGVNPNCPIGSVCSDSAECVYAEEYPLYGAPCPGGSYLQWCGVLTCIDRKCVQCIEGAKYGSAVCLNGIYRDDTFALFVGDPNMWIGMLCIGVFLISGFSALISIVCKNKKLKKMLLIQNGISEQQVKANQKNDKLKQEKLDEQEENITQMQTQLSTMISDLKDTMNANTLIQPQQQLLRTLAASGGQKINPTFSGSNFKTPSDSLQNSYINPNFFTQ